MQARSALFDLYGDYLRPRGGRAPVAALVRLLAPARYRRSRGPHRGLPDGAAGLAAPAAAVHGPGLPAHPEGHPPARRGRRPDLPHRPAHLGRPVRPARDRRRRRPRAERQRLAANLSFLGYGSARRPAPGSPPAPGRRGRRPARPTPASGSSGSPPATPAARRRARRWSGGPGTCPSSAAAYERVRRRADARCVVAGRPAQPTTRQAYAARFTLVHALAHVPVPRPAAAAGAAARPLARHRRRRLLRPPRRPAAPARRPVRRPLPGRRPAPRRIARMSEILRTPVTDPLLVDRADGAVATLTLNRPDSLNALDVALKEALRDALDELAGRPRPAARWCWPAPAGPSASGRTCASTSTTLEPGTRPAGDRRRALQPDRAALAELPKPVVAAVRGMAAGRRRVAGPARRLPRSAARSTAFLMAFANVGLAADTGASWTLPRLVGHAKATELLMLAEPVSAAEALPARACSPAWSTTTRRCCRPPRSWPRGSRPARRSRTARSSASWPRPRPHAGRRPGGRGAGPGDLRRHRRPPQRHRRVRPQATPHFEGR